MNDLSEEQLAQFEADGYLYFPSLFKPDEVKALTDELEGIFSKDIVANVREKNSKSVRTSFAIHTYLSLIHI